MNFESFIVRRFIRTRKKRNFISFITYIAIVGVMIGTASMIIALTIVGGFEKTITEKVIGFSSHIVVQGFQTQPLHNYKAEMDKIKSKVPEVIKISPFVGKEAMVKSKNGIEGVYINGVDADLDFSSTRNQIIKGIYSLDIDPASGLQKIIIGNKLANKLNLNVGEKIVVLGINGLPSPLNMPKIIQFQISGIYETGISEYDDINVYVSLKSSQELFQLGDAVLGFNVQISNPLKALKLVTE